MKEIPNKKNVKNRVICSLLIILSFYLLMAPNTLVIIENQTDNELFIGSSKIQLGLELEPDDFKRSMHPHTKLMAGESYTEKIYFPLFFLKKKTHVNINWEIKEKINAQNFVFSKKGFSLNNSLDMYHINPSKQTCFYRIIVTDETIYELNPQKKWWCLLGITPLEINI